MAAVVPTVVQINNIPTSRTSGTGTLKRLAQVFLRVGAATASDTVALATYVPNVQTIEAQLAYVNNVTQSATLCTWSGTALTLKDTNASTTSTLLLLVSF